MEQMRHLLHGHSCRWLELLRYLGEAMLHQMFHWFDLISLLNSLSHAVL